MKSFARWALGGFAFASQGEAERRATICAGCYFNVNPSGCGSCAKMATLITGEVARKSTPHDERLKACAVCKCALKSLVHFPLEAIATSEEKQAVYPDFCWQKIGGENYLPNEERTLAAA